MRRLLACLYILFIIHSNLTAQVKSTGVVNLLSGMTANLELNNTTQTATLTLTGPSDRWFALQFGDFNIGDGMKNGEDIVYFNGTNLIDAVHNGIGSTPSNDINHWSMISNTVSSGTRTVVASRTFNTADPNDYTFNFNNSSIDFAFSRSSTPSYTLAYHGSSNRGYAVNNSFSTLGIDDHKLDIQIIELIPNPASTSFLIQTTDKDFITKATIYNALGQKVLIDLDSSSKKIDISNLRSGNYYVEVETNLGTTATKKLIIK